MAIKSGSPSDPRKGSPVSLFPSTGEETVYPINRSLTLHILSSDRFCTGRVNVHLLSELSVESASYVALLYRLLTRGCEKYPSLAALRSAGEELWGASVHAVTDPVGEIQNIVFSAVFPDDGCLPDGESVCFSALSILREVLYRPLIRDGAFLPEYVESEKQSLIAQLENTDNKAEHARFLMESVMFEGEKFAVCCEGEGDRVREITPEGLYDFYLRWLNSVRMEVYYHGSVPTDRMIGRLAGIFGESTHTPSDLSIIDRSGIPERPVRYVRSVQPIHQGRICMGFRAGCTLADREIEDFMLFCEILGRSPTNKLFLNLREKKGLCYAVSLSAERFKGFFRIECGIDSDTADEAVDEILAQLDAMRRGQITQTEFDFAKRSLISSYKSVSDDPGSILAWNFRRQLAGRTESPADAIRAMEAVTLEGVIAIARRVRLDTVFFLCEKGAEDSGKIPWEDYEAWQKKPPKEAKV